MYAADLLKKQLPIYKDWPKPGINFIDINGICVNPFAFQTCIEWLKDVAWNRGATSIVAIESRGFIFGSALASQLKLPIILVRKPNKLPGQLKTITYETEYSTDSLSIQANAPIGKNPLIIDDLLATGGTIFAVKKLLGADKVNAAVIIHLSFLSGYQLLKENNISCDTLIVYDE